MSGKSLLVVVVGLVAVLLLRGGFEGEPAAARAQAGKAGEGDRSPPELKKGVRVAFKMPNHPFDNPALEGQFEGAPVVDEVRGRWVRVRQAIAKDAQAALKQREVSVWVNFDLVSWYGIVP
jgi:hypothetical protein